MKAIVALVLVVALIGVTAIGIADSTITRPSNNGADSDLAPGQTGTNPGQSDGAIGAPGQTGENPGQAKKGPV